MVPLARRVEQRTPFLAFLAQELAPREGRGLAVARIATACTITVAIAMVFRIPLAAYMAYMVFLTSKDDSAATVTMAVAGALAITLAVIFTLGLAQIDLGDPALMLAIEIDGGSHNALERRAQDAKKEAFLIGLGWTVLRFLNADVIQNLANCVLTVASTISKLKGATTTSRKAS